MPRFAGALLRPASWSPGTRRAAAVLCGCAVVAAMAVTSYRTLRPAENLNRVNLPLPSPAEAQPQSYAELTSAPLIIDGRLRVFADQRRVWAETPVTASRQVTPRWAYRRWPAEVVGVVSAERTFAWGGPSLVVTKWSDGQVIALNATTGEAVWQVGVEPDPDEVYKGRRTGAQTVYAPEGLFTATSAADGRTVLLVTGRDQVHAYDPYTGVERWAHIFPGTSGCHRVDWTGETTYVVKDICSTPAVLDVMDAVSGARLNQWRPPGASAGPGKEANWYVEPAACALGRSRCKLFRAAATAEVIGVANLAQGDDGVVPETWRLNLDGTIGAEANVSSDAPMVVGDIRIEQMLNGYIWAHRRSTGALLWITQRWSMLLAVDDSRVYAATRQRDLVVLDATTGQVVREIDALSKYGDGWLVGFAYPHEGYLTVERLGSGRPTDDDEHYYYAPAPTLLFGA